MNDYIKREDAIERLSYHTDFYQNDREFGTEEMLYKDSALNEISELPSADVIEADKAQKEIDYWHDKAQSYEQTILKLSLNKADVVEVVRCKDCRFKYPRGFCESSLGLLGYCSKGERADE